MFDTRDLPSRKSIRLPQFNYSEGAYFLTICTHNREPLFGNIIDGEMRLGNAGRIVEECIGTALTNIGVRVDCSVIMPNHIHAILIITELTVRGAGRDNGLSLLAVTVRGFKSCVSRRINQARGTRGATVLQRGYFEHVVRNEKDLNSIREYIANNPAKWDEDNENPNRVTGVRPNRAT